MAERRGSGAGRIGERLPGALVSGGALLGLVVGVRAVVAWEPSRAMGLLRLPEIPREGFGLTWSDATRWPDQLQAGGLDRIAFLVAGLVLAAAAVALVGSLLLLFEAGASRRRELALRSAVGAPPAVIVLHMLARIRTLGSAACALGLLLGITLGAGLRWAWPGTLEPLGVANALATALPVVAAIVAVTGLAYLRSGIAIARGAPLSPVLLDGGRTTAGRGDAARRRIVPALQMGVAGSVVIGAGALAVPLLSTGVVAAAPSARTHVLSARLGAPADPDLWVDTLERVRALPGVEGATASTPGTLLGLGPRTISLAHCGECIRGLMYAPFWSALADHHAVAPGTFADAGIELLEGRDFTAEDGPDAAKVAIVNRTFANTAFEKGQPIGRRLRLGPGLDDWYTVVGIVDDVRTAVVGGDDLVRSAVYVSLLQRPAQVADVLVTGSDDAVLAARDVLATRGFVVAEPETLDALRVRAAAPLVWTARVAGLLCLIALALAMLGARMTALHITRHRVRELAVRRALGAGNARILGHVLGGAARSAAWGSALAVFGGALLVAWLRKAAGGVPAPGPAIYLGVTGLLVAVSLVAALRAGREALLVEPASAMD